MILVGSLTARDGTIAEIERVVKKKTPLFSPPPLLLLLLRSEREKGKKPRILIRGRCSLALRGNEVENRTLRRDQLTFSLPYTTGGYILTSDLEYHCGFPIFLERAWNHVVSPAERENVASNCAIKKKKKERKKPVFLRSQRRSSVSARKKYK